MEKRNSNLEGVNHTDGRSMREGIKHLELKVTGLVASMFAFTKSKVGFSKINPNLTTESGVGAILDIIFQIGFYVGAIGVVMGIFITVQSFLTENPESRNKGITFAVVGAVLMGLELLLKTAGIIQ